MGEKIPEKYLQALRQTELEEYLASHATPEPPSLTSIVWRAEQEMVFPRMVSGHLQGLLLTMLVRMIKPRLVLELGTFAGYATAALARGLPEGGRVVTAEIDESLEPFIRKSLTDAGVSEQVEVLFGDVTDMLEEGRLPAGEADLVYIDANKRHYTEYYLALMKRLRKGTFVLADNVLWGGKVTQEEAHDLQTAGIRAFNDCVRDDPRVEQVILPQRDGLSIIYVK